MSGRERRGAAAPLVQAELSVEDPAWGPEAPLSELVDRALSATLARARPKLAPGAELSVLLTSDDAVRALNRDFRGQDQPTNVLSFPAGPARAGAPTLLGDVAVARGVVEREAAAEAKSVEHHLTHLIVHGVLHLLGHDHETEAEADAMEALETLILGDLGVADPYADSGD